MKTKLLYVLVSSEADVYMEQAFVSATSCARRNPDAVMTLLTDRATSEAWLTHSPLQALFKALFSEIVVVDLDPALSPMQRSRLLKTGMRGYVKGDFLFIDADTIVARPLGSIDTFPASLAVAPDLHCTFKEHPHRRATINICKKIDYNPSGDEYYYNSGVMLVRDTPENHSFFERWQKNYFEGLERGVKPDQPSLAKTNATREISTLPDEWNCEVQNGVRFLRDAFIVHYMVTNLSGGRLERLYLLNDPDVLLGMRKAGRITPEIEEVIEDPFKGYARLTQVFAGEEVHFFRTRRYRWMRSRYFDGKPSPMEFLLKLRDHLPWRRK